ncbi:potassium channel family protein [Chitinimonas naiadis]
MLLARCAILAILVACVLVIFWVDRDGLKDQIDGDVSFTDIVYFTAVTITTVGYGDIVPVSDRARIVDALLVTPLRLMIWLIFMGTAYELVLQRWIEARRMQHLQGKLDQHLIICGFGHGGQSAASEAVARGTDPKEILVLDLDTSRLTVAAATGYIGLLGDATSEQHLSEAGILKARAIMICLGRDDATVLAVLTVRQLNPQVRIVSSAREAENIKLLRQAGSDAVVAPSMIGGYLMTNSVQSSNIADYVSDLMQADGRIKLIERPAQAREIGLRMREVKPELVVRLHRPNQTVGFWEGDDTIIREGDLLIIIEPNSIAPDAGPR